MRGALSDDHLACVQSHSVWSGGHECVQNDALSDFAAAAVHLAECVVPADKDVQIRSAGATGSEGEGEGEGDGERERGNKGKRGLDCLF